MLACRLSSDEKFQELYRHGVVFGPLRRLHSSKGSKNYLISGRISSLCRRPEICRYQFRAMFVDLALHLEELTQDVTDSATVLLHGIERHVPDFTRSLVERACRSAKKFVK